MEGLIVSRVKVNETVAVTAVGFRKNLVAYPRRIEFRGATYDFIDTGLRCLVRCGGRIAEVVTMSDGANNYFLRTDDSGKKWVLLGIAS